MARYKTIDTSPRFLAVNLEAQLLPGTFEQPLNHLLDHEIDLSDFDARFANDCDDRSKARTVLRAAQRLRQAARGGGSPERVGLTEWLDEAATRSKPKPLGCLVTWRFTHSILRRESEPLIEDFPSWQTFRSISSGSTSRT